MCLIYFQIRTNVVSQNPNTTAQVYMSVIYKLDTSFIKAGTRTLAISFLSPSSAIVDTFGGLDMLIYVSLLPWFINWKSWSRHVYVWRWHASSWRPSICREFRSTISFWFLSSLAEKMKSSLKPRLWYRVMNCDGASVEMFSWYFTSIGCFVKCQVIILWKWGKRNKTVQNWRKQRRLLGFPSSSHLFFCCQ